jgi:hypothetical protein
MSANAAVAPMPSVSITSMITSLPVVIVCGLIALGLWSGVWIQTASLAGDLPSWNMIHSQVTKVVVTTMLVSVVLLLISLIYFIQDQTRSIYVLFILIGLSAGLSYSAMAASAAN